jgi:PTS system N-acetylgalactosamine-specific IID component
MLGVFIVGALTSNYGGTTVATVIENGDSPIVIQSILDGVLPKLIPLALTLGLFFLMKKKNWKPGFCSAARGSWPVRRPSVRRARRVGSG